MAKFLKILGRSFQDFARSGIRCTLNNTFRELSKKYQNLTRSFVFVTHLLLHRLGKIISKSLQDLIKILQHFLLLQYIFSCKILKRLSKDLGRSFIGLTVNEILQEFTKILIKSFAFLYCSSKIKRWLQNLSKKLLC